MPCSAAVSASCASAHPTREGQGILTVEDTGIGIEPDKIGSLFTPFFTEKGEHAPPASEQARVRGISLSLSVTSSIVTGAQGRIDVSSTPGSGTTFTVRPPCEKESGQERG